MEMHGARGFAQVPIATEKAFKRFQERAIITTIRVEKGTEGFLIERRKFTVSVQVEEQAIDPQARKRVQLALAKEATSNFERLLRLTI